MEGTLGITDVCTDTLWLTDSLEECHLNLIVRGGLNTNRVYKCEVYPNKKL